MRVAVQAVWSLVLFVVLGAILAPSAAGRVWSNTNGIFSLEAELVSYDGKVVELKAEDGRIAKFEASFLSAGDNTYLKQTYPNGKTAPKEEPAEKPKTDESAAPPADENAEAMPEEAAPAEEPPLAKAAKAKAKAKSSTAKASSATKAKSTSKEKAPTAKAKSTAKSKAPAGAKALLAKGKTPSMGEPGKFDAAASETTTIDVLSLTITKPLEAAGDTENTENTERQNTRVRLMLADLKHQMCGLDDSRSLIVSWVDNQGTDLLKVDGKKAALNKLALKLAPDGHSGTIDLSVPAAPASGAIKMRVRGELHIRWGKGERIEQIPSLALAKGTQVSMALMLGLTIDEVKPLDLPDTKMSLTLSSPVPTDQISKLIFSNVEGKVIPHQELGSASFGKGDKKSYQRMIGLSEAAETVSLQLYTFENFETMAVPIDLEFGVGL